MLCRSKALFEGYSFQVTVLSFFEILQKFFFPLLAMTFLLLIERNKVDAATIELLGTPQMICTTFAGPCSYRLCNISTSSPWRPLRRPFAFSCTFVQPFELSLSLKPLFLVL